MPNTSPKDEAAWSGEAIWTDGPIKTADKPRIEETNKRKAQSAKRRARSAERKNKYNHESTRRR
jgi:hypothetical protein